MTTIVHINQERARFSPAEVYASPIDIVHEIGLTRGQKRATLARWRKDLCDRIRATGEGMTPPDDEAHDDARLVRQIDDAMRLIEQKPRAVGAWSGI